MLITATTKIIAIYDKHGYGCFTIVIEPGTQQVSDDFGSFLIENYDGVIDASVDPSTSAAHIESEIAALQVKLAEVQATPPTPEVPTDIIPDAPSEEVPSEEAPSDEASTSDSSDSTDVEDTTDPVEVTEGVEEVATPPTPEVPTN